MLTITPREAYPSLQVEESPSTVTPRLDMLALRILHCHNESTGAGPDRPWASTVSLDASVPSRQEDAHTSSYRRSYYESLPSCPRHPRYAGLTLHHSTITPWGACPRRRSSKLSSCDLYIDVTQRPQSQTSLFEEHTCVPNHQDS